MAARRKSPLARAKERAAIEQARLSADIAKRRRGELKRLFEGAQFNQYHPRRGDQYSADAVVGAASTKLRSYARYLDENHDLAIGILDQLCARIIGCGVTLQPMVMRRGGTIAPLAKEIKNAWRQWTEGGPDVTRSLPWPTMQSLICRSWLRDGELLVHHVEGTSAFIRHGGRVPYSLELIESDYLPFDLVRDKADGVPRIIHGVELNDWKQPIAYHLYKEHPGDMAIAGTAIAIGADTKRVPASEISHLKFTRRLGQTRGVSVLHGVLRRLEDIKDYEESERIAARVAAAFTAVIKKSADFAGAVNVNATTGRRDFEMAPGMIFDQLLPGEDVSTIGSDRPNSQLEAYRNAMLRAAAAGTGTSYSSISRNYNGTYSSQRQELIEAEQGYDAIREYLIAAFYRPVYRRFIDLSIAAGVITPRAIDDATLYDADWIGPAIPWIDPKKEAEAAEIDLRIGIRSRHQIMRERQYDPDVIDAQIAADTFEPAGAATAKPTEEPDDGENENASIAA